MKRPDSLIKLIENLSKLPSIGEKTASRLAFYLVHSDVSYARTLAQSILEVKEKISLCSGCMNITESDPCSICSDSSRDRTAICVVEGPSEMIAIEKTGKYRGLYHVLHGNLSPLDGVGPSSIRVKELIDKIKKHKFNELIIATSPTVEGEGTAAYLKDLIRPFALKVTRIASGVPMGGDLKFVDDMTLGSAMEGRRDY